MTEYNLDFSSHETIELPVKGPNNQEYMLREADGGAVARYNSAKAACIRVANGKVSGVAGQGETEILLVSLCLFAVNVEDDGSKIVAKTHVTEALVRSLPGPMVAKLFETSQKISEIDQDDDLVSLRKQRAKLDEQIRQIEEEQVKNEPSSTGDGLESPATSVPEETYSI